MDDHWFYVRVIIIGPWFHDAVLALDSGDLIVLPVPLLRFQDYVIIV